MAWIRENLGGPFVSPSSPVYIRESGQILVFSRGAGDNSLWVHYINPGSAPFTAAGTNLQRAGGVLTSTPHAVNYGGGNSITSANGGNGNAVAVFARGSTGEILAWWWPRDASGTFPLRAPSTFSTFKINGSPAAISRGQSDLEIFVNANNRLWQIRWLPAGGGLPARWTNWMDLSGNLHSDPYAITRPQPVARGVSADYVHVYTYGGPDDFGHRRFFDGASWGTWHQFGLPPMTSSPLAVPAWQVYGPGNTGHLVFTTTDKNIPRNIALTSRALAAFWWDGSSLLFEDNLGDIIGRPGAIQFSFERFIVFASHQDGTVKYRERISGFWSSTSWKSLPGVGNYGEPRVIGILNNPPALQVFAIEQNNGDLIRWRPQDYADI